MPSHYSIHFFYPVPYHYIQLHTTTTTTAQYYYSLLLLTRLRLFHRLRGSAPTTQHTHCSAFCTHSSSNSISNSIVSLLLCLPCALPHCLLPFFQPCLALPSHCRLLSRVRRAVYFLHPLHVHGPPATTLLPPLPPFSSTNPPTISRHVVAQDPVWPPLWT